MLGALQIFDLLTDGTGFFLAIPSRGNRDFLGLVIFNLGMKRFAETAFVIGDQMRGCGKDMSRGAIIAFQSNDLGAGKIFLKPQNVIDLCATPTIDGLVVVTNAADIIAALGQQAQPEILRDIGVLILVHQNIAKALVIVGQYVRVFTEEPQAFQKQISKITGIENF